MLTDYPGIYVHIPFCMHKCRYCDFFSIKTDPTLQNAFLKALWCEIDLYAELPYTFDTIYLGGGTPSILPVPVISALLDKLKNTFKIMPASEITIEANPGTLKHAKLKSLSQAGITRINIGVQSFCDQQLHFLGRRHSGSQALAAIKEAVDSGLEKIGIDLIYGLPDQTPQTWTTTLKTAADMPIDHLSCYILTYEPETPLYHAVKKGEFTCLSETLTAQLFQITFDVLAGYGFEQYEVSNFARSHKCQSRHNRKYWNNIPYLGLGPAGHSYYDHKRLWNHTCLETYLQDLSLGKKPLAGSEKLSRQQEMIEALYLGLRQNSGLDIQSFNMRFKTDFNQLFKVPLQIAVQKKFIIQTQRKCTPTRAGLLLIDTIAAMFIDVI